MKRAISVALLFVLSAVTPSVSQPKIELFADEAMGGCELFDSSPGIRAIYMFHTGPDAATGSRFVADRPECWNASWAGDEINPEFISIGDSQTDLSVAYGSCLQPPIYIGRIMFFSQGSSGSCCLFTVTAAPAAGKIEVADCNFAVHTASAGSNVMINPTQDCPGCVEPPIPPDEGDQIVLYADEARTSCGIFDSPSGVKSVYVFHTAPAGRTGSRFAAPKPSCWQGASWLSDQITPGFVFVGNSQTDLTIGYGSCRQSPILLGRIDYYAAGVGPPCCSYRAGPSPQAGRIEVTDCNFDLLLGSAGTGVTINPDAQCPTCAPPPDESEDKIELFADEGMNGCGIIDDGPAFRTIYMFHTGPPGRTGSRFAAPRPFCWQGASWIGDQINSPFVSIGNSQADLSVAYGSCVDPPVYIGRIIVYGTGAGLPCCSYHVVPSSPQTGRVEVTDCGFNTLLAAAGTRVRINPNPACAECDAPPVRVQATTWGRIKAMYRDGQ